ncbi:MAG: Rrf2 family transcriptional regulator [Myxococcota bacterium]
MAITTRSEYGMRAMILLAEQMGDELLSTTELARRAFIPRKYLEQILRDLKHANLVTSRAGVNGGYRLARPPRQITAGQIVCVLDKMNIMTCVGPSDKPPCDHQIGCSLRPLWQRVYAAMNDVLDSTTLEQLAFNPCLSKQSALPLADDCAPGAAASQPVAYQI